MHDMDLDKILRRIQTLFVRADVLQMMGRAGRPQYDTVGIAVVMVHAPKKNFYKRFLYEPFPVESSLADVLQVGERGCFLRIFTI